METMKESGIQWIGAIPESWNTKRIKYMTTLKGRVVVKLFCNTCG